MADLQIPEDFCQQGDPKGKTSHSDGENFHYIWGDGRTDGAAFSNDDVKAAYEERGEEQVPLGIHEWPDIANCFCARGRSVHPQDP